MQESGLVFFFQIYSKKITVLEKTRIVFSQRSIVIGEEAKDIICFRETPSEY